MTFCIRVPMAKFDLIAPPTPLDLIWKKIEIRKILNFWIPPSENKIYA